MLPDFLSSTKSPPNNNRRLEVDHYDAGPGEDEGEEYEHLLGSTSAYPYPPLSRPPSSAPHSHTRRTSHSHGALSLIRIPRALLLETYNFLLHPFARTPRVRRLSLGFGRVLPASAKLHVQLKLRHRFTRRALFTVLFIVLTAPVLLVLVILVYGGIPPSYHEVRLRERGLPQHVWGRSVGVGGVQGWSSSRVLGVGDKGGGEEGPRYLRFPDHLWGHGLNNVLQEALLTAHVAHASNRTFVFEDYVWSHLPLPYTLYDFALRPTRVPLGAFLGGPLAGGPWDFDDDARDPESRRQRQRREKASDERRAISSEYFEHVCPPSEWAEVVYRLPRSPGVGVDTPNSDGLSHITRSGLDSDSGPSSPAPKPPTISGLRVDAPGPPDGSDGVQIVDWFRERLSRDDVRGRRCVLVREEERRVFDANFFGSTLILPLFPSLRESPVIRGFAWSPLVQGALERSVKRLFGAPSSNTALSHASSLSSSTSTSTGSVTQTSVLPPHIPGILALHLRRGDYKRHCVRLAHWGAGYMGFNLFEGLDVFDVDAFLARGADQANRATVVDDKDEEDEEARAKALQARKEAYYLEHCLPTIAQIVKRLHVVREEYDVALSGLSTSSSISPATATSRSGHALRSVYVLTNGWSSFVDELRVALLEDGWERVVATPDLEDGVSDVVDAVDADPGAASKIDLDEEQEGEYSGTSSRLKPDTESDRARRQAEKVLQKMTMAAGGLTREEKGVSVAVDMGLAERAEVFVGNGFSSLSANIVMLRTAKGFPVHSNRFL